jgi:L-seryl-tRNA(Ser) seleniumtransferase
MNETEGLLRSIPHVDRLLRNPILTDAEVPRQLVTEAVRKHLAALRERILSGAAADVPGDNAVCEAALRDAAWEYNRGIKPVVNGTGVILHSNLGRACLSEKAAESVYRTARGFSTLEYDLGEGCRGSRTAALEEQLIRLTGAEAALVVNNNAAAVLLVLSVMAGGGAVVVSRGELVEIGGSFRVPEIMEASGCRLREVGTTNKTRIGDYERAIGCDVRAILKVHTSNFKIVGFSESVTVRELSALGQKHAVPVIEDIGSGALVDPEKLGFAGEPFAPDSLRDGADVVTFSGDKLLGGPQAGVILGKKTYLSQMKKHPLYRALRVDKLTVAALEETLRAYLDVDGAARELPVLRMLSEPPEILRGKAERLATAMRARGIAAEVVPVSSTPGSGSVPGGELESFAVAVSGSLGASELDRRFRLAARPVVGRIVRDSYLLDVRTMFEEDLDDAVNAAAEALL